MDDILKPVEIFTLDNRKPTHDLSGFAEWATETHQGITVGFTDYTTLVIGAREQVPQNHSRLQAKKVILAARHINYGYLPLDIVPDQDELNKLFASYDLEDNLKTIGMFNFLFRKKEDDLSEFSYLVTQKFGGIAIAFDDNSTMLVKNAKNPQYQGNDLKQSAQGVIRAANDLDKRYFKHNKIPSYSAINTLLENKLDRIHAPPATSRSIDRDYGWS